MAIRNFGEMIEQIKATKTLKVAVAAAEDEEVLAACRQAQDEGLASCILTGSSVRIEEIASKHSISLRGFEIIDEPDHLKASIQCCKLIRDGDASIIMKGLVDTSRYMKAILNRESGLNTGNLLSHVAVFEIETYPKLLFVTDAGVNIAPDLNQKVSIIKNAVTFAKTFGIDNPLVACCTAIEKVNARSMPATVDAALLTKMNERGQIKGCIVDGPFGLDNAVSEESARIKKINSPVAGKADIILCNDIESANYLYKSLVFFAKARAGAIVTGSKAPIVLPSRADSHETKYHSLLTGLLNAHL